MHFSHDSYRVKKNGTFSWYIVLKELFWTLAFDHWLIILLSSMLYFNSYILAAKTMATIGGLLNILALIFSVFFLIFSMASYPKITTKCLFCLISISKLFDSSFTLVSLAVRWTPWFDSHKLAITWFIWAPYLEPLVEFHSYMYIFYSIHSYAVIADKDSFFQTFQSIKGLIGYSVFALIMIYACNVNHFSRCVCFEDCDMMCKIIPITDIVLKTSSLIVRISLQFYIVRSTFKIMAATEKFLCKMSMSQTIVQRLIILKRIKRFNIQLTVLMILLPGSRLLRKVIFGGIGYFCPNCYTETVFEVEFFTFDVLKVFTSPVAFLIFVFLHLNKLKDTCFSRLL